MIVIDANVLIVWSARKTPDLIRARLSHLLETAAKNKQRVLIPTPALAEFLVLDHALREDEDPLEIGDLELALAPAVEPESGEGS